MSRDSESHGRRWWKRAWPAYVGLAVPVTIALPILVSLHPSWLHRGSFGPLSEVFELFGLCVFLLLGVAGILWKKELVELDSNDRVAVAVVLILLLCALSLVVSTGERSYDYRCYENAARAIAEGKDPYENSCYLYPPALAELLAGTRGILYRIAPVPSSSYDTWWLVFFCFQALEFYLLIAAVVLCLRLGWRVLGKEPSTTVGVAVLLLLATPIHQTLRFQQANLLGLAALAYAFLELYSGRARAGVFLAVSCLVKPLLALIPLAFVTRRSWRVMLGFAVTLIVLVGLSVRTPSGWSLYRSFLDSPQPITAYPVLLRDQSLLSLIWNTSRAFGGLLSGQAIAMLLQGLYFVFIIWIALRMLVRRRHATHAGVTSIDAQSFAMGAALSDLVMLSLILSPLAWPHNYVIAIPPLIWNYGVLPERRRALIVAAALMMLPTTFEVYPLSYHRLAGAVFFLVVTGPGLVKPGETSSGATGSSQSSRTLET